MISLAGANTNRVVIAGPMDHLNFDIKSSLVKGSITAEK